MSAPVVGPVAVVSLRVALARRLITEPSSLAVPHLAAALGSLQGLRWSGDVDPCREALQAARAAVGPIDAWKLNDVLALAVRAAAEADTRDTSSAGRERSIARTVATHELLAKVQAAEPCVHVLLIVESSRRVLSILSVLSK